jgi:uncharacterized protein with HEPN domain
VKKREYRDYLIDIATSINDIELFIEGMTYEDFLNDKMASNAVIRSLEVIGEATKNLPKSNTRQGHFYSMEENGRNEG